MDKRFVGSRSLCRNALVLVAAVGILILGARGSEAQVRCTSGFRFCDNCDTVVTFYTTKSVVCRQNYFIAGGIGAVFSQKVTKRPRGIYGTANQTAGAYQPPPGYVGDDYFEVVVKYDRSGTRYTTTLR
jgi:hypothetical protein